MENKNIIYSIVFISLLLANACSQEKPNAENNKYDYQRIVEEIKKSTWAFHTADTSKNAEGVINLMWPESTLLIDGNRISYKDVVQGVRDHMSSLRLFHTEWADLQIVPTSAYTAISSFIFTDSIINMKGELKQAYGPNTFVWQKREDEWRILYVDADHYPVLTTSD